MGTDIETYRAAVGAFYLITHRRIALPKYIGTYLRMLAYCTMTLFMLLFLRNFVKNDEYLVCKVILLLACMDMEMNPGPSMADVRPLDIFHLNTRSIRNKTEYINNIVEDYHILCFTETHLDDSVDSTSIQCQGFDSLLRKDKSLNGGGVMIYMSNLL